MGVLVVTQQSGQLVLSQGDNGAGEMVSMYFVQERAAIAAGDTWNSQARSVAAIAGAQFPFSQFLAAITADHVVTASIVYSDDGVTALGQTAVSSIGPGGTDPGPAQLSMGICSEYCWVQIANLTSGVTANVTVKASFNG